MGLWEGRGLWAYDADPRPTRKQAASDFGGLGISSLGQRRSQAVDEGRYDRSLDGREPRLCIISVSRRRIEVAYRVANQVGAKRDDWRTRKEGWSRGSCGQAGITGGEGC